MNKDAIKQIRNRMIKEMWENHKAEWAMSDLAFIFGLKIAQIYRIVKGRSNNKTTNKQND